jgi:hypothetical protein
MFRGTVKKDQFQLVDDQGQTIVPQEIQRIAIKNAVHVISVVGVGH